MSFSLHLKVTLQIVSSLTDITTEHFQVLADFGGSDTTAHA